MTLRACNWPDEELWLSAMQYWTKSQGALHKGGVLQKDYTSLFLRNKVFVRNDSGLDILVYVQRSNAKKVLTGVEVRAQGGPTGGGVYAKLEYALTQHKLQKEVINATVVVEPDTMFEVGGGAEGAYITAMLKNDTKELFCVEREVPCGYRLIVRAGTFVDSSS